MNIIARNLITIGQTPDRDPLKDRPSWCDWPKASEFTASGNVVTITKEGFCRLIYTKQEA